jgi:class 3 adenylate cyclase/tetratricopeptide (TPR) repeat protein
VEPDDRFCGVCGSALTGAAPAAPLPPPVSERRMVSILFADLVGFTPLSEDRDPESVREFLSRYFELATTVVGRHGGTIEKFIGDAVVAVWGTPVAQEDDAERAVRTALELAAGVPELQPGLAMRAAVSTGEVAVTVGATSEGMVAGDVVNTTARMQTAAPAGGVLVDEATHRAAEAAIRFEPAGLHELKGKSEPVALWHARQVVAERGGGRRSHGLEPPFVGRSRELRLVQDMLHTAADQGRAHLVSVIGTAGIGKSRLSWELEKYVDGLAGDFLWHRGRCLSYGEGVAFWALAEMVRMRARISEEDDLATARGKLSAVLEQHLPDAEERAWAEPPLLHLLGLEELRDGDRSRLFAAWRLFIERMTQTAPVMLVFEDMQWADQGLLDFVEYLLEWSRSTPLFVLALARPELTDVRPSWGAGSRAHTSLVLEPLPADAVRELLAGLGLPEPMVAPIVERAEGIPLYAVETVRMLVDKGRLVASGDGLTASGELTELDIPETLHALVLARLDALEEEDRLLLQAASVLGKTFTADGLAAVAGQDAGLLAPRLDAMVRRELLSIEADPRSPERGQYGFVQALVRTIAYETMGRRERKRRHLAAADHLASLDQSEELIEVIATHRLDAYRLVPDDEDADRLRGEALDLLLRAADRATSLAALQEAERLTLTALELSTDDVTRAQLLTQAATLAMARGEPSESRQFSERALAIHRALGDDLASAHVLAAIGDALFLEGRADDGVKLMRQAYDALKDGPPSVELAELAAQLGRLYGLSGKPEEGIEALERAIDLAERLHLPGVLSDAMNSRGVLLTDARPLYARTLLEGALRVALENDVPRSAMRAYFNLSFLCECSDTDGRPLDMEGLLLARRLGDRQWERSFSLHLAMYDFFQGKWDSALAMAEALRAGGEGSGDLFVASGWLVEAQVLLHRGALEAAREALQATGFDDTHQDPQQVLFWRWTVAALRAAEGDHAGAAAIAARARGGSSVVMLGRHAWSHPTAFVEAAALRELNDTKGAADLRAWLEEVPDGLRPVTARALLAWLTTWTDGAAAPDPAYAEAESLLRSAERPRELAVVLEAHAASLAARGHEGEARRASAEAQTIYEGLGALPALERLRRGDAPARAAASGSA